MKKECLFVLASVFTLIFSNSALAERLPEFMQDLQKFQEEKPWMTKDIPVFQSVLRKNPEKLAEKLLKSLSLDFNGEEKLILKNSNLKFKISDECFLEIDKTGTSGFFYNKAAEEDAFQKKIPISMSLSDTMATQLAVNFVAKK